MKPEVLSIPEFYQPYIKAIPDLPLIDSLEENGEAFDVLLSSINEQKGLHRYADDKWTVKEVIQHIIDSERIFIYRALRFCRGDQTDLHGFDQNEYVENSDSNSRSVKSLQEEFKWLRSSTISFFRGLNERQLSRKGIANGFEFTVNAMGYLTVGHLAHHMKILKERYLIDE
jgi:hypothetical protein